MNRKERRRRRKLATDAGAAHRQVVAHLEAGRDAEAEALLRRTIADDPFDAEALHLLGMLEYRRGRLEDAADLILRAADLEEDNPLYHANCGAVLNLLGRSAEAEAASRHAIDLAPGHAEAHNNLGVALDAQGRADEALAACERAIALKPDYPEAHINLGNIRFRRGRFADAAAAYHEAARHAPANPMAHANLAAALRHAGRLDEAEAAAREAVRHGPTYAEARNNLGNVLKDRGNLAGAVAAFEQAIRLRPAYLDAHLNLAGARYAAGEMVEAEAAYRKVVDMAPKIAEAHRGLGVVLLALGRLDEATECFRQAVRLKPTYAEALYDLASSGAELGEGEIARIAERLDRSDVAADEAISLHFALGETLDRRGKADEAFRHFRAGNALKRTKLAEKGVTFDAATHDRWVEALARAFDRRFFAARGGYGHASETPVFIVGMPRSGTTLIEQIAASHPAVAGAGEIDLGAGLLPSVPGFPEGAAALDQAAVARLADDALARLTAGAGRTERVIDKTPANFLYLGLLALLFPRARAIHCRRDARDVALSCFFQNFAAPLAWTTDLADIARYHRAYRKLMAHWEEARPLSILTVDYERMVADPETESRRVVDFLGLPWNDSCLRFHDNKRVVRTASSWQVRRPIYGSAVGRWRAYAPHLADFDRVLADAAP